MKNLIDQQGKFNEKIRQFPNSAGNIAIFGSQSSGKSTLLNAAFGTHFPILNTAKDRQRCTKGIWNENNGTYNIVDTEGFDSVERKSDERIIERQIALFCLAISDILIINLWMNEVGRYQGGQVHILKAIIKASHYLIKSQTKTLYFIIKDCTVDANQDIIKDELEKIVDTILNEVSEKDNLAIKFNLQFYFMSHYMYKREQYNKEANQLVSTIKIKKAFLNQYEAKDRVVYLRHLWQTITANEGDIDLRVEEEALKIYITNKIRNQIQSEIQQLIVKEERVGKLGTYERFYEYYIKKSFEVIKLRMNFIHNEKMIKEQFFIIEDQLEHTIQKHFTEIILPNQEQYILKSLLNQKLQTEINSIQLQKKINDLRKSALQYYKVLLKGHKQSVILIKRFAERITQYSMAYEAQVGHLFNMFQTRLENQINKELDRQLKKLEFNGVKITNLYKSLCKQFKYNQWEVNTKQIWEKVCHRLLTQRLLDKLDNTESQIRFSIFVSEKQLEIIARYKQLEQKVQKFIKDALQHFEQEDLGQQYVEKAKAKIREMLYDALIKEKRRFKMNMVIFVVFLFFFYSEFEKILKFTNFKKMNINRLESAYIVVVSGMIIGSIVKKIMKMKQTVSKK